MQEAAIGLAFGYTEIAFGERHLGGKVEALWSFRAGEGGEYRILPDGRVDVLVRFRTVEGAGVAGPRLVVAGPNEDYFTTPIEPGAAFIGVRFKAGWGPACLGVDGSRLRDRVLLDAEARAVVGPGADLLLSSSCIEDLRSNLQWLAAAMVARGKERLGQSSALEAIDQLHLSGGRLTVADLAAASGIPERSLRRAVLEAAGLAPKSLAAVLRFQRTLRLLRAPGAIPLAQAAFEGGYSDQSHMTRDFLRHGGFTPNRIPPVTLVTMDGLAA